MATDRRREPTEGLLLLAIAVASCVALRDKRLEDRVRRETQAEIGHVIRINETQDFAAYETGELSIVLDRIQLVDHDTATVWTSQRFRRSQPGEDGKQHEVLTTVKHREEWQRLADGWRAVRVVEIEQGVPLVNGQPSHKER